MTLKVKSAWKESLIRLLNNGVPLTEAAKRCRVGTSMVNQELRRDLDFKRRCEVARELLNLRRMPCSRTC